MAIINTTLIFVTHGTTMIQGVLLWCVFFQVINQTNHPNYVLYKQIDMWDGELLNIRCVTCGRASDYT